MISILRIPHKYYLNIFKLRPFKLNTAVTKNSRPFCEKTIDVNTNVAKDVILFKHDNPRFFKMLNIFAASQFVFWTYLSVFSFTTLRDAPANSSDDVAWWRRINLGENKFKNTLSVVAFLIGYGTLSVVWLYTLKSVRYLILCKGGKNVAIVTYTPMGKNRMFTINLKNVTCEQSRSVAKSQLPLKIKGHYLNYMLDMRGEFKNPTLFDYTAGLQRKWKTV